MLASCFGGHRKLGAVHPLQAGADSHAEPLGPVDLPRPPDGLSLLARACRDLDPEAAARLLDEEGASPRAASGPLRRAPLHHALAARAQGKEHRQLRIVMRLLGSGANPSAEDTLGLRPLHLACQAGRTGAARHLIEFGADPSVIDRLRQSPLHYACARGHDGCALLMLRAGASPAETNVEGLTPLRCIEAGGHVERMPETFEKLREHTTKTVKVISGAEARKGAFRYEARNHPINALDTTGSTQLAIAVRKNALSEVRSLLRNGADPNVTDFAGWGRGRRRHELRRRRRGLAAAAARARAAPCRRALPRRSRAK